MLKATSLFIIVTFLYSTQASTFTSPFENEEEEVLAVGSLVLAQTE